MRRIVAGDDLGHGVGEVDALAGADVALDDRRLGRCPRRRPARAGARRSARSPAASRRTAGGSAARSPRRAAKWTNAPSRTKPVFSATNGFCSTSACRPRCCSSRRRRSPAPRPGSPTRTPRGRPPMRESSGEEPPVDEDQLARGVVAEAEAAGRLGRGRGCACRTRPARSASGDRVDVRVPPLFLLRDGKPTRSNRAMPRRRRSSSHAGPSPFACARTGRSSSGGSMCGGCLVHQLSHGERRAERSAVQESGPRHLRSSGRLRRLPLRPSRSRVGRPVRPGPCRR